MKIINLKPPKPSVGESKEIFRLAAAIHLEIRKVDGVIWWDIFDEIS